MKVRLSPGLVFLVNWGFALAVALLIPDDPAAIAALGPWVNAVAHVVPAIHRIPELSEIPHLAQVFWSLLLPFSICLLPAYFLFSDERIRPYEEVARRRVAYRLGVIAILGVLVYMAFLPFSGRAGQAMLASRWGLGLLGGFMMASVPYMLRAFVTWWRYQARLSADDKTE